MTDAGWTSNKPTEAGWYWYQGGEDLDAVVVWVAPNMHLINLTHNGPVRAFDGLWLGPLSPDTYHQGRVAGLVAVKDYLETRAEIIEGAAHREMLAGNHVKESNERSALAEIHAMQSVIRDLEQQAQEGERKCS